MSDARIGGFRAVGLGLRALRRNLSLWVFGLTSEGALAACRSALFFAAFLSFLARFMGAMSASQAQDLGGALDAGLAHALSRPFVLPIVGAWLALECVGAVLRIVYLAATIVDASAVLKEPDRAPAPVIAAASSVFARAVAASFWLWLVSLASGLARAVFWGASWIVVVCAFSHQHGGFGASAAGALGLTLGLMLALLVSLFGRVYLVQAVRHREASVLATAWDAATSLGDRLGTYLLIAVVGSMLAFAGNLVVGGLDAFAGGLGGKHVLIGQGVQLLGAALVAAWAAAVEIAMVGAVCAVDLDARGELPKPPAPPPPPEPVVAEPVATAQEVLVAQVIEPKPTS
ncbi:MAG: hypothetical protein JST54_24115 [Deltaproteobacteria bacterium]|nr:hypothetical protein [Deltaproteobacteria bacterium]